MPPKIKIATIALLWITIGLSATFAVQHIVLRIVLVIVVIGVTIHIVLIRTYHEEDEPKKGGQSNEES